jgi:hypothetical protein
MATETGQRTTTSTGSPGTALVNGTPTILSLTTPAAPARLWVNVALDLAVTSAETGGALTINYTSFGSGQTLALDAGGHAASLLKNVQARVLADAGTAVTLTQAALTAGAATANASMSVQG